MVQLKTKSVLTATGLLCGGLLYSGAAEALTVVPPDLAPGSQYRLVFVTDGTRDATSTNIADYNTFVTNDVVGSQLATDLALEGLTPDWFAIASTESIDARNNTSTTGTGGVPIYLITGERVADNYGDLWDLTIQTEIDTTPSSTTSVSSPWTGSFGDGSAASPLELGSDSVFTGLSNQASMGLWINSTNTAANLSLEPLYAISSVLEVPQAQSTPEPSSLLGFITLGGFMLGGAVRRTRQ